LRPYSPGAGLNALAPGRRRTGGTPSPDRLGLGLPGYLILFGSPSFRSSASVVVQRAAFATGVPADIYAFHRYTCNSTRLSHTQAQQFFGSNSGDRHTRTPVNTLNPTCRSPNLGPDAFNTEPFTLVKVLAAVFSYSLERGNRWAQPSRCTAES